MLKTRHYVSKPERKWRCLDCTCCSVAVAGARSEEPEVHHRAGSALLRQAAGGGMQVSRRALQSRIA